MRPIVFALSNPKTQAEITAERCYEFTKGAAIFGSGTRFDAVTVNGKTREPGQVLCGHHQRRERAATEGALRAARWRPRPSPAQWQSSGATSHTAQLPTFVHATTPLLAVSHATLPPCSPSYPPPISSHLGASARSPRTASSGQQLLHLPGDVIRHHAL